MGPAHIGSLSLQFKVLDSFFLYGRIDNLYNTRYSTVAGYPEQGRTIVGGLRIVI
jgi:outer membrane cobalamin receptor